ncbi:MAG: AzlD domain-containing protein [Granulosicoccus sp.]
MSYWQEVMLITGMMVATFGVRYPILALSGRIRMPPLLIKALGYVPVAVLSAITVPMMLAPRGELSLTLQNEYLVAGVAAIVFVALTRHLLWTIILGMALFLALRFLL